MNIDMHVHTEFSYRGEIGNGISDSTIKIEDLPIIGRQIGLDGIVITDHMTMEAGQETFEKVRAENPDFLLLRGMEYHSDHSHLLIFGISNDDVCRKFKKYGPAQKVIDYANQEGGATVPSHPFQEGYKYALKEKVFGLKGIAALEVLNGALHPRLNMKAIEAAKKLNLQGTGGSDAHYLNQLGNCYTQFEAEIRSMEGLVRELKQGNYCAFYR